MHRLDEPASDGQAETDPRPGCLTIAVAEALEGFEHGGPLVGRHPATGIDDAQVDPVVPQKADSEVAPVARDNRQGDSPHPAPPAEDLTPDPATPPPAETAAEPAETAAEPAAEPAAETTES